MTTQASAQPATERTWLARHVVDTLGGRYSVELGIDVQAGDAQIERWFLAATLFGTRITAQTAERTYRVLTSAGLVRVGQARHIPRGTFIGYLDQGGYARCDGQKVARPQALSEIIGERYDGQAALIGQQHTSYPALRAALGVLPGWGPVTIQLFLRELRGVWPGPQPPLDPRAEYAARHLGLTSGPDALRVHPARPASRRGHLRCRRMRRLPPARTFLRLPASGAPGAHPVPDLVFTPGLGSSRPAATAAHSAAADSPGQHGAPLVRPRNPRQYLPLR